MKNLKTKKDFVREQNQIFLVSHRKTKKTGLLIKESIHKDFFIVLCSGSLEEWYIDNIDEL